MKKIIGIYAKDMRAIVTNYAALLVVLALCILPSLYAWFNIKASWDPYGKEATRGIKIGVVNLDQGAELNGTDVRIGDQIIAKLKKNDQLGWRFMTVKEAENALESEKIYASVTITQDFSESLISIVSAEARKGKIIYTVNEKINAIAPKLTEKGVTSLQNMISQTVVETVSNVIFDIANQIGVNLEEQIPNLTRAYEKLLDIQSNFGKINNTVDDSISGVKKLKAFLKSVEEELPTIVTTIENCKQLGNEIDQFIASSRSAIEQIGPSVLNDLWMLESISREVSAGARSLQSAVQGDMAALPDMIGELQAKIESFISLANGMQQMLQQFNELSLNQPFTQYVEQLSTTVNDLITVKQLLDDVSKGIENSDFTNNDTLQKIIRLSDSVNITVTELIRALQDSVITELNSIFNDAISTTNDVIDILTYTEDAVPDLQNIIQIAQDTISKGERGLAYVREILPKAEGLVNEFVSKLSEANTEEGLRQLIHLLTSDVASRSDFLANPVEIVQKEIYPMGNYGTGMTPFYTVLSLWVGVLLLSSMLTVEADAIYKPSQVYFGKLLTFISIALIQALIVSLGDLYLLDIYCVNPFLFVIGNLFVSITFTVIVYSLVSVLGNIGKVIGIVLLVLQVAGSGGTFPIQLTPRFFQLINPFLPFTYGISFGREAIGGVVREVIMKDIWILILYIIVFVIISLLLKGIMNRLLAGFTRKFVQSGLGEHQ